MVASVLTLPTGTAPPLLPLGPTGHYHMARDGAIRQLISDAKRGDQKAMDLRDRIFKNHMWKPLWNYRPLPEAVNFHKSTDQFRWCFGGNRCVAPWTMIDSPDGGARRIDSISGTHRVWAWNGYELVPAMASEPFVKGYEQMYRLRMSNGQEITVTGQHRILTPSGWISVSDAICGSRPVVPTSVSEVTIAAIEAAGIQPVWDIEVHHPSHSYLAHDLIHHNSSKSESLAYEVGFWTTGTHPFQKTPFPCEIWYATLTWDMVGSILWNKMKRILAGYRVEVIWHNRSRDIPYALHVHARNKVSKIHFKAYEQKREAFQGTEKHLIAMDEQCPQDIYTESISRIGGGFNLRFAEAATPLKAQPWLEEKVNGGTLPNNWGVFEYPLDDNRISRGGFIEDQAIDNLIDEWPEEVVDTRRNGKWASFLGAVYKTFTRKTHVMQEQDEAQGVFSGRGPKVPPDWKVVASIDWGALNPFVFLLAVQVPHMDNMWYVLDEYYWDGRVKGMRLIGDHAKEIKKMIEKWKIHRLTTIYADHDAQDRFEMSTHGYPTVPAVKDVGAGIECVQTAFKLRGGKPNCMIAARCKNTVREHVGYRWGEGTENREAKDEPIKKDDHSCDALRYLLKSEEKLSAASGVIQIPGNKRAF